MKYERREELRRQARLIAKALGLKLKDGTLKKVGIDEIRESIGNIYNHDLYDDEANFLEEETCRQVCMLAA
jgi:hypothetical protein